MKFFPIMGVAAHTYRGQILSIFPLFLTIVDVQFGGKQLLLME